MARAPKKTEAKSGGAADLRAKTPDELKDQLLGLIVGYGALGDDDHRDAAIQLAPPVGQRPGAG